MERVKVGIVGIGNISGIYLKNLHGMFKNVIEVVGYADLIQERADKAAADWGGIAFKSDPELYDRKDIEIVLNLTTPGDHFEVCRDALVSGKSTHVEKPLSIEREQAAELLKIAQDKGLRVGGAPDTFLGGGIQTCRKLIDDGWIGTPVGATAFFTCRGHERWHPDPEFYYKYGAGPMFDMGPYYVTALVNLMGPVKAVTGSARKTFPTRTITSEKKYGNIVDVEVDTHITGTLEFASGAIGTIMTSFDVWDAQLPRIEIYGTEGSLSVPDPNGFDGPVKWFSSKTGEWSEVPIPYGYRDNSRGLAVADMACAIRSGRQHRANGNLANHVLDVMRGVMDAAHNGKKYELITTCERPAPLPLGLRDGFLDL